ncbi:hypothetical protein PFISCL1PPCAC_18411, partial [Pristionchus fissidentatus]
MRLIIISPLLFATVLLACAPMCPTCTLTACKPMGHYSLKDCGVLTDKTCYEATITATEVKCSNPDSKLAFG